MDDKIQELYNEETLAEIKGLRKELREGTFAQIYKAIHTIKGEPGKDGVSIKEITSERNGDDLTIKLRKTDDTYTTFTVKDVRGHKGDAGRDGKSATIEIVKTDVGEPAVKNVGTENEAKLEITLPEPLQGKDGKPGKDGIGKAGRAGKDGKGVNWRGIWNNRTRYEVNDAVQYIGSSYICVQANTGNVPGFGKAWDLMALKGASGGRGPAGPSGGGGEGGAVESVNGETGEVVLTQDDVGDGTTYKQYSQTEKTKLAGIATGATANDTDANLKNRANHTGTQTASTISDFDTEVGNHTDVAANTAARHTHANQSVLDNTTASFTTADETKLDGIEASADVTDAGNVGSAIHGSAAKTTPVDADTVALIDSAASNVLKKVSWANIKATLKTYFDTLYATVTHSHAISDVTNLQTELDGKADDLGADDNYVTDAEKVKLGNLSGTNSGDEPSASTSAEGVVELATPAETTSGTDTVRAITPDALAGSNYGIRTVGILVSDPGGDALTTGDGKAYFRVPSVMDGFNLVAVAASLITSSSSGIPTVQIRNATQTVDMLSTKLTIDAGETDSSTAAAAAVIDTNNDDVATGDKIHIDIDVAGTGAKGLFVELQFQLP